jgi:hypothetical protein
MTTRKGCDAEFRKGTLAFLLTPDGLKESRVCAACVKRGVLLVPGLVPPVNVEWTEASRSGRRRARARTALKNA